MERSAECRDFVGPERLILDEGKEVAAKLSRGRRAVQRALDFLIGNPSPVLFSYSLKLFHWPC